MKKNSRTHRGLSDAQRQSAIRLQRLLEYTGKEMGRSTPLRLVQLLALVELSDDSSMMDLALDVDAFPSTTSRDLLRLGAEDRNGNKGYEMVWQRPHPLHPMRNEYGITEKGRRFLDGLTAHLEGPVDQGEQGQGDTADR
jgi:hypothetical protein